jgi:hypothetical protein
MRETIHHAAINLQGFTPTPVERVFREFADLG